MNRIVTEVHVDVREGRESVKFYSRTRSGQRLLLHSIKGTRGKGGRRAAIMTEDNYLRPGKVTSK